MTPSGVEVAVTGENGRLGRAVLTAIGPGGVGWRRPELDLDRPATLAALVERDDPKLVVHTAAMTDVDACARDPETAQRRNGDAVDALARACRTSGAELVLISTNEVFDGERSDGLGYAEDDDRAPRNPYGMSKLAGEVAAIDGFDGEPGVWIVRTSWLYGPPGNDFPDKIVAAADRLASGEPLPVVSDEFGSPTSVSDLAGAILDLTERTPGGTFHLVNAGHTSRQGWAEAVLAVRRPDRAIRSISRDAFERASDPPPWGVLGTRRAAAAGITLSPWHSALEAHLGAATLGA